MSLFHRVGLFVRAPSVHRHRGVGRAPVGAVPFAPQLPGALRSGGFTLDDLEASQALGSCSKTRSTCRPVAMVILLQSTTDARAGDPAFEAAAAQTLAQAFPRPTTSRAC